MALKVCGRRSPSNAQALMWCAGELGPDIERVDPRLMYGAAYPHLRRYYGMSTKRPAVREHVMVSYDELRVHV